MQLDRKWSRSRRRLEPGTVAVAIRKRRLMTRQEVVGRGFDVSKQCHSSSLLLNVVGAFSISL